MQTIDTDLYPAAVESLPPSTVTVALTDAVQEREVNFRVHIPAAKGPHPVVVFSHGALCSPAAYDRLTTHWATRGYAVIVAGHLDAPENPPPAGPPDLQKLLSSRVRDLSFALDAAAQIEAAAGATNVFDLQRAAAAGHSFGALGALIKVGLPLKPGEYQLDGSATDSRFSAAISLSGVGPLPPMADDAFAALTCPLIATGGSLDEGNVGAGPVHPWEWRLSPYTLAPPGDKFSLALRDADHYLGGLIANEKLGGSADPVGLATVAAVTTAFLDTYLRSDGGAAAWLRDTDLAALTEGRARFERK